MMPFENDSSRWDSYIRPRSFYVEAGEGREGLTTAGQETGGTKGMETRYIDLGAREVGRGNEHPQLKNKRVEQALS
jgi:hypothetical protein